MHEVRITPFKAASCRRVPLLDSTAACVSHVAPARITFMAETDQSAAERQKTEANSAIVRRRPEPRVQRIFVDQLSCTLRHA